jgi:sporulation protein YlmC with PRC-barrel domain
MERDAGITVQNQTVRPEQPYDPDRLGLLCAVSMLKGMKTRDLDDHAVGNIQDLVLDLGRGRVLAAWLSSGRTDQVIPVPPRCFVVIHRAKAVVRPDRRSLEGAPRLAVAGRPEAANLSESWKYFGQPAEAACTAPAAQLSTSSSLLGMPVVARNRQTLGTVEDLMVDLPLGQLVYVVVAPAIGAEAKATRYVVPPTALGLDPTRSALVLETDAGHFLAGPKIQTQFPTDMVMPEFASSVQRHYGQPVVPAPAGQAGSPAPASHSQGGNPTADREMAKAVFEEILRVLDPNQVKEVVVLKVNDRFVLSGHMRKAKEIQVAVAAAERVVGIGHVDNQLQSARY